MYTPEQIQEIVDDFTAYIKDNDDPTIVKFTANYEKYSINKDYINNHEEFCELRKKAIQKQEAFLLEGATNNKTNPTFSIFRLKQPQHGYKDRIDTDLTSGGEKIKPIFNGLSTGGTSVPKNESDR
jgi:hypothetical protein